MKTCSSKSDSLFATACAALALAAGLVLLSPGHSWGDDFAQYILQARGIVEGTVRETDSALAFASKNSEVLLGPRTYPWGLPLCLAPIYAVAGLCLPAFKIVGLACFAIFAFVFSREAIARFGKTGGMLVSLTAVFCPPVLLHVDNVLSDIPFLCISFCSLLFAGSFFQSAEKSKKRPFARRFVAGVLLGGLFFVACEFRTNGFLLPVSFLAVFLAVGIRTAFSRNRIGCRLFQILGIPRTADLSGLLSLPVFALALFVFSSILSIGGEGHLEVLGGITPQSVVATIRYTVQTIPEFFGIVTSSWKPELGWIAAIWILASACFFARKDPVALSFFAFSVVIVVAWPAYQGPRFLFPLFPWAVLWVGEFAKRSVSAIPATKAIWLSVACLLLVRFGIVLTGERPETEDGGAFCPESVEMFKTVSAIVPSDGVVAFEKPRLLYLMTGRKSTLLRSPDRMEELADWALTVDCIKWSKVTDRLLSQGNSRFRPVVSGPFFSLYAKDNTLQSSAAAKRSDN